MRDAFEVANYVIEYCNNQGYSISNLKLQKILYFIQAAFLVDLGEPCFTEDFEAWDFGPVIPVVYQRYKVFGNGNIRTFGRNLCKVSNLFSSEDKEIIDDIIEETSNYSASKLVEITHNQDPWLNSYRKYCNNIISKKSIKDFFESE